MMGVDEMVQKMRGELAKPMQFSDVIDLFQNESYQDFLLAWGELREQELLSRLPDGRYLIE